METVVLLLFCGILVLCLALDLSIVYALAAGLLIFCAYAKIRKYTWRQIGRMVVSGIKTARNILLIFLLIGMLTALWRACGTIPVIICYAVRLIRPATFVLMTFLLNCGISVLTGTAFGTAATMGVICMSMAATMQMNPVLVGGAILSGVFFGDRCSPVSTSALLVSELTETNIFNNIKGMIRTATIPFLAACVIYGVLGYFSAGAGQAMDLEALFGREFSLHWITLLPAVVILTLSLLRVNVKIAMSVSIAAAIAVGLLLQGFGPVRLLQIMFLGYTAGDPEVAAMLNGGGVISMVRVASIVCLSSAYAGIFQQTGLLGHIQKRIVQLSGKITPFGGTLCTGIVSSMIACNQTLAIMLTHQLCKDLVPEKEKFAIYLEDTAVVVAPLIPWSIAGAVPLASVGAPTASMLAACFLYLLPAWRLLCSLISAERTGKVKTTRETRGLKKP